MSEEPTSQSPQPAAQPQDGPEKVHGDPLLDIEAEAAAGGGPELDGNRAEETEPPGGR
jgi:hypothetical protein